MKKLLTLILTFFIIISPAAHSQITAAVSVDGTNNLVYPLDGNIYITNTNAVLRFSGTGSILSVTNSSNNGLIRIDDAIVRDSLEVTNYILSRGTFTNLNNAVIGGTLTVTNTGTFNTNVNVSGNLTNAGNITIGGTLTVTNTSALIGNTTIGGTLTVTNTGTFNTNVNVSGNLTNAGNITINTATTITSQTNHAVRKDYVDNFPLILTYDATGVTSAETVAISNFLTTVAPATIYPTSKEARVLSISNQYTLTATTNNGSFITNLTIALTTNSSSFVSAVSSSISLTTNALAVKFNSAPGTVAPTNNGNATTFSSIDVTSFSFSSTTNSSAITNLTAALTTNVANAITNLTVSIGVTTTRKLFTWIDVGSTWSNSTIITNTGLQ